MSAIRSLSRVKRTCAGEPGTDAIDPSRTFQLVRDFLKPLPECHNDPIRWRLDRHWEQV